jgi:hypothetical protein
MIQLLRRGAAFAVANVALLGVATLTQAGWAGAPPPPTFHCAIDASCPEITVAGDPPAMLGGSPAPFRGYGDPSIERDPATGTLWMTYSWLDVLVTSPGPPPIIDFGVRTHLARSDNGGASWIYVREINTTPSITHPDTSAQGWPSNEVSTLVREPLGGWQALWLTLFDPTGLAPEQADRTDPHYVRSTATTPAALGDSSQPWARGYGTSASFGVMHDLSQLAPLADCVAFTEPALFAAGGVTYLATNCVVFAGGVRQDAQERLVLLRQDTGGYAYVGALLDGEDASDLGASRIEQADIALSQSGRVLLIATPIQNTEPQHLGCVVFEITDIAAAQVRRDGNGDAVRLMQITGEDAGIGPGLCAYDAASSTGVVMVLHIQQSDPFDLEFSMRATGQHPGRDEDMDGLLDHVDNCPDLANTGQSDADVDALGDLCEPVFGTDPADTDTDGDGCRDGAEARPLTFTTAQGGRRDPLSEWDFYDVPAPAAATGDDGRPAITAASANNLVVSLQDVGVVLAYVGRTSASPYYAGDENVDGFPDGPQVDRTPSAVLSQPWRSGPPNGAVSLQDVGVALVQVGHTCVASP